MRTFTIAERRARLARRHFLADEPARQSLTELTASIVGWHATDPTTPYLSLWARSPGFTVTELDAALYRDRTLVKQLAMRRTLWLVPVTGLTALLPGASERVAANERRKLIADVEKSGVAVDGAQWLASAAAAVKRHLGTHGPTSAAELRAALPELAGSHDPAPGKRWGGATPLAPRVLTVLAVQGEIVRGPNEGRWTASRPRWTDAVSWLGAPGPPLNPADARVVLVRTWLRAFGPASLTDITWWFGATATTIRQALADIGAVEVDMHGTTGFVLPDDCEDTPAVDPWAALLPGLDVTTMGWSQRDWYLGAHRDELFDSRGNAGPTAWWDGRVVGGWNQDGDGRVRIQLLEDPGRDGRKALSRKADELTDWLDGVQIKPRFPSPVTKSQPVE